MGVIQGNGKEIARWDFNILNLLSATMTRLRMICAAKE